ncbi:ArnT family glycosyltransferase [Fontivita pretiosa]|uniref:ArnT family glycosyltransferase n=1 Tax=Fontivita pretiosa TaxID=2989684 RepID=UPI003D1836C1
MTVVAGLEPVGRSARIGARAGVAALWILAGVALFVALGNPPVTRTQEARVLETARQMLGSGPQGWLLPRLNEQPRLKKPPLCYWMSAAAYKIAGVSAGVGRAPGAMAGWLMLAVTYLLATRLFDRRIGLMASTALLGSYLFFRHVRLAETDAPAALFVTLAIWAMWRADQSDRPLWPHLAAAAIGGAILAKGAPAIFPPLFVLLYCAIERRWHLLWRFIASGAIATLAIVALPWFIYVANRQGLSVFASELSNTISGGDHGDWPTAYLARLLVATAPWSGLLPLAIVDAIRRFKTDASIRMVLLWCAAILLPLSIAGNKQPHYLLPLMPPVTILIGRLLAAVFDDPAHWARRWCIAVLVGTILVAAAGIDAILYLAVMQRGRIGMIDAVAAAALATAVIAVWLASRRSLEGGFVALLVVTPILMPLMLGLWAASLHNDSPRQLAGQIRRSFGPRATFASFGPNESLPLCFELRQSIPDLPTPQAVLDRAGRDPNLVLISIDKSHRRVEPLPDGFVRVLTLQRDDQVLRFYRLDQGAVINRGDAAPIAR